MVLEILKDQIANYHTTFSQEELDTTKNLITKGNTRAFETLNQLMGMVTNISYYNLPDDYLDKSQKQLDELTLKQAHQIIAENLNEQEMIYVIVGDAKTQLEKVKEFGYGDQSC